MCHRALKYGVPNAKKNKILCHLTFVIHIQSKLYTKDKFFTLLNFNYTLLDVNYMLSNNYCTLLKADYMFDVNCKLSYEYFVIEQLLYLSCAAKLYMVY